MEKFSTRLKELRSEAGVSMQQLASAVGVSNAAICKWENGEAEPKVSTLIRLSEFFDCTVDYLVGKTDDFLTKSFSSPAPKPFRLTKKEREIINIYRELNPNLKNVLEETLNTWKKL